jgi:pyruvate/2-oxoglutarate dehydrogenase complex dihydrolipoamide acyltransferase (E2) component
VDIGDGKDVAFMLVRDVDRKSVEEIARFVEEKAMSMKSGKGGEEHRKRTANVSMLPSFVVSLSITLVAFITTKLGLSIPSLSFESGQFGAGCVSAVGKFGFEDSYAPMPGFMQCSFIAIINAIKRVPVIEDDDSIKIGQVMNVNFSVDHRVVDGAKGRKFLEIFKKVMENPEQYVTSSEGIERKEDKGKNIKE